MGSKAKILLQIILLSICLFAQSDVDGPLYIVGSDPKLYVPKTPSAASVPDSFLVKLPDNSIGTYPLSFTRTMISGFWAGPFWDSIPDKPSSFTPKLHHHDSLYYRKSEVTTIVNGKEPAISTSTSDKFWNGLKQWVNITIGNVFGLNDTITNHRTAIASKLNISDTSSLARKNHGHSQSQITGLVDTVTTHRNAINNKQPLDTDLTTIAGLTHSAGHVIVSNGSAWTRRALEEADLPSLTASKLPSNIVYTDNAQTITGEKTFTSNLIMNGLDNENVLISKNVSASNENQFYIKHDYASTRIGNYRGDLHFISPQVLVAADRLGIAHATNQAALSFQSRSGNRFWISTTNNKMNIGSAGASVPDDGQLEIYHNSRMAIPSLPFLIGTNTLTSGYKLKVVGNSLLEGNAVINGNTAFGKNTFVGGYRLEVAGNALVEGKLDVGDVDSYGDFYLRSKMRLLNKAGNGWVDFVTRNVSGSEAAAEIENVKSVNGYVIEDGSGKIYREAHPDDYLQLFTNGTGLFSSSSMVLNANYGESPIQLNCSRVKMGRRNVGEWTTINIGSGLTEIDIENYPGVQRFKFEVTGIDAKVLFKNAEAGDEIFVMTDGYGNPQIAAGNSGDDWTFILGQYIHLTCEGNASLKIGAGWYTGNTWIQW